MDDCAMNSDDFFTLFGLFRFTLPANLLKPYKSHKNNIIHENKKHLLDKFLLDSCTVLCGEAHTSSYIAPAFYDYGGTFYRSPPP